MKVRFLVAITAVFLAASIQTARAQGTVMTFTVDKVKRQALVFLPKDTKAKAPLVFAWHGHGGNMNGTSNLMHIQTLWPEAIVVYPQGLDTVSGGDPQGNSPGWQAEAGDDGDRDLKFYDVMLSKLQQQYTVDDTRIYSMGFSNGAFFSYLLWSSRPASIAAFAICAGKIFPSDHLTDPRAVLIVAGKTDPKVHIADQEAAIQTVRQLNGTGNGQACGQMCTLYPASTNHTGVMTFIHPGGHVYPPWASAPIVKFFKEHTHP